MTGLTTTVILQFIFHLSEKARMPSFDNSIYFPYQARRGSSRLYFSPEKSTLWMASIIFSSQADKDCILCSFLFLKIFKIFPCRFFFCARKICALRGEHLPQESFRQQPYAL